MTFEEALRELGVTADTLTAEEKKALDEQGYVLLEKLMDPDWLEALRSKYEKLMEMSAGTIAHQKEAGVRRLFDLENQGSEFDGVYLFPKLLAAAYHLIKRDFKMVTMNGRDAIPGEGKQGLHSDVTCEKGAPQNAVTCVVMLDDFTPDNGATRVVPGTHTSGIKPTDPSHPDEIVVTGPAGSVIVMASHLWHGGTQNRTAGTRRALHPFFMAKDHPPSQGHLNGKDYIRVKTYKRLSPAARYILDVEWDSI